MVKSIAAGPERSFAPDRFQRVQDASRCAGTRNAVRHPIALHQDALDPKPAVGDVLGAEQSGCWTSDGAEIHSWSVYPHRPEGAFDADIEMGQ
jgi:hypothetical protein